MADYCRTAVVATRLLLAGVAPCRRAPLCKAKNKTPPQRTVCAALGFLTPAQRRNLEVRCCKNSTPSASNSQANPALARERLGRGFASEALEARRRSSSLCLETPPRVLEFLGEEEAAALVSGEAAASLETRRTNSSQRPDCPDTPVAPAPRRSRKRRLVRRESPFTQKAENFLRPHRRSQVENALDGLAELGALRSSRGKGLFSGEEELLQLEASLSERGSEGSAPRIRCGYQQEPLKHISREFGGVATQSVGKKRLSVCAQPLGFASLVCESSRPCPFCLRNKRFAHSLAW